MVTGTETELLSAWRTYSDFYSLADTAKSLRVRRAVECWHRLEALGYHRRTDPSSLRTAALLLNGFLATLLEELHQEDIAVSEIPTLWCIWTMFLLVVLVLAGGRNVIFIPSELGE